MVQPTNPNQGSAANPSRTQVGRALRTGWNASDRATTFGRPPAILTHTPRPIDLLYALRRRWGWAFGLGLLCAIAAMATAWYLIPVTYSAAAWLRIAERNPRLLFDTNTSESLLNRPRAQATLMTSDFVLNAALRKPGIAQLPSIRHQTDQVAWLREHLSISFPDASEIMQIAITGQHPEDLVKLVNAVKDAYMDEVVTVDRENAVRRKQALERSYEENTHKIERQSDIYNKLANQLQTADSEIARQKEIHALQSLADLRNQVNKLRGHVQGLKQRETMLQSRLSLVTEGKTDEKPDKEQTLLRLTEMMVRQDPSMLQVDGRIQFLEQAKVEQSLLARGGEKSRAVRRIQDQIDLLCAEKDKLTEELTPQMREVVKEQLDQGVAVAPPTEAENIQRVLSATQLDKTALEEELKAAHESFEAAAKEAEKLGSYSSELESRRIELERLKKITDRIGTELQHWEFELAADAQRVTQLQEATVPKSSGSSHRKQKLMLLAGLAAFGAAVFGVVSLDFVGYPVSSADELSQGLGVRVMGGLPLFNRHIVRRAGRGNTAATRTMQGVITESVDSIRTNLLHRAGTDQIRTIIVTSALEKEGKTTVSCQLAASLARSGRRTLLVDGDIRRPAAHRVLDLPLRPGIAELLRREVSVQEVIRPTRIAGLWLIPAGVTDPQAIQALAQGSLEPTFAELRNQFDFVLIDCGPVLTDSDAVLFGQFADAVLLSVLRDVSRVPRVYEACERLHAVDLRILGAVINGASVSKYRPYDRANTIEVESASV